MTEISTRGESQITYLSNSVLCEINANKISKDLQNLITKLNIVLLSKKKPIYRSQMAYKVNSSIYYLFAVSF